MSSTPRVLLGLLVLAFLSAPALAYTSGGTFVAKSGDATLLDNGGVICKGLTGDGTGGGCLPFPLPRGAPTEGNQSFGGFVGVIDDTFGRNVAFQVCIDNNGDGICGGDVVPGDGCRDQIFFSHADGGQFFNPLGPLPSSPLPNCPNAFQGYVVLLCQGAHNDPKSGVHSHALTTGHIFSTFQGTGYGNFCGGGFGSGAPSGFVNAAAKAYRVE